MKKTTKLLMALAIITCSWQGYSQNVCGDSVTHCYTSGSYKVFDSAVDNAGDFVTITIVNGETEAGYDDLVVYDTADTTGNILYSADGIHSGQEITSTTGTLSVWIDGDSSWNCVDGQGGPYAPLEINITCTAPPACPNVTNLSTATQADGSVNLDWDDAATATGYDYEIQPDGVAQGTAGSLVSSSAVDSDATVTSGVLTDGADYTLYVISNCGMALGNYQSLDFSYNLPPANDTCAGAIDLALETSPLSASITDGTTASEDTSCLRTAGRDVFYSILVPSLYDFSFNQVSNDFDSVDRIAYGGVCPGVTQLRCSDGDELGVTEWTNNTGLDQTVYIVIEGYYDTSRGDFTIQWSVDAPPACPDVTNLSTATQADGSVNLDWDDAATATGYDFEIQPDGVAQGTAGSLVSSSAVDSDAMVASGVLADGADYTLYVTSDCGGSLGNYQSLDFSYNLPQANDTCAGAIDLALETSPLSASITDGTTASEDISCGLPAGRDVFYSILVPSLYDFSFNQVSNDFDSVDRIAYGGVCPGVTQLRCSDSNELGVTEWTNNTGLDQTVYIVIEGWSDTTRGDFTIQWSVDAPPSCTNPVATMSDVSDVSATATWSAGTGATTYDWEVVPAGNAQGVGVIASGSGETGLTVSITGLSGNTDYDFLISSDCTTDYATAVSFTTLPGCGDTVSFCYAGGTTKQSELESSGNYITATVNSGSTESGYDDLVIYDSLDASGTVLYTADGNHAGVSVTSTTGFISAWVDADGSYDCDDGNAGSVISITFTCAAPPSCPDVTNLNAATQADGSVNLDWDDAAAATVYNYEIQPDGVAQGTAGSLVSSSAVDSDATVASGVLAEGADYTLYVVSDCGMGDISNYQSLDFSYIIPPVNIDCANATSIGYGETIEQDTTGSTGTSEGIGCTMGVNGVWFTFVGNGEEVTVGSEAAFDHRIAIGSGSCGVLANIVCDDQSFGYESHTFTTTLSETYYIYIAHYSGGNTTTGAMYVTLTGADNIWDGTAWSLGTPPTLDQNAIINGLYDTTANGNITAASLEINATHILNVTAGGFIDIAGDIYVDGNLNVAHTGNVVQRFETALAFGGNTTVTTVSPMLDSRDFQILGSPMDSETREGVWATGHNVQDYTPENFIPNSAVTATYNFADDNLDDWNELVTGALTPGAGYLVFSQDSYNGAGGQFTYDYNTGDLNSGVITQPLHYNGSQEGSPNMLSNPYASSLNAFFFFGANPEIDTVYFWEHGDAPMAGVPGPNGTGPNYNNDDVSAYNLSGGIPAASGAGVAPNGLIATSQGFGVFASAAGTATFNNAMRSTTGNTTLRTAEEDRNSVWLHIENTEFDIGAYTLVGFTDAATAGYDRQYDNYKLSTAVSIFSHMDGDLETGFSIQSREAFDVAMQIPMGFASQINTTSSYSVSLSDFDGDAMADTTIYLVDNVVGTVTNLNEGDYGFTSEMGTFNNRFTLQFVDRNVLANNEANLNAVVLSPNPTDGLVNIVSPRALVHNVVVTDIQGRVVSTISIDGLNTYQLDMSSLGSAMYFVQITTDAGSITKRLIKK